LKTIFPDLGMPPLVTASQEVLIQNTLSKIKIANLDPQKQVEI